MFFTKRLNILCNHSKTQKIVLKKKLYFQNLLTTINLAIFTDIVFFQLKTEGTSDKQYKMFI